jgi:cellulose synthase/poly-beta-1,6-N-acetylglucosamine synthase-like glycosyltransferase
MEQVVEEDVKEAATRVLTRGLVRKVVTPNGIRYEITDAGWQFVREYEEITAELGGGASNVAADSDGVLPTGSGLLSVSLQQRPELIQFSSDPAGLHLLYEVMRPEIGVMIPTLNEVNTIGNVLKEIPKHVQYPSKVLVIDASGDETSLVARKYGAKVLRQHGQGKGAALRQAFCALDSDIVVMMDGDGCMQAEEIPRFVKAIVSGADMVKGSRFLKNGGSQDLSFIRKVGNLLFVTLVNLFWSGRYTDLCYGFLAFRREALERLKPYLTSDQFEIETEICIRANKLGLKVVEVPSVELKRSHGESKLSGMRTSLEILQTILHEFVSRA